MINSYQCKDGKWIFLSILEHERYYKALCQVIEREDLSEDSRFSNPIAIKENAPEFISIMDEAFAKYTQAEMVEKLLAADIAHEKYNMYRKFYLMHKLLKITTFMNLKIEITVKI